MGEFPSGQRGQTVNLLATPTVVRIHLPPPTIQTGFLTNPVFLRLFDVKYDPIKTIKNGAIGVQTGVLK